jgi:DNA-binding transcriptional ArsR family regulator
METQLDPFQALADLTRRSIVEALRNGERQVNDIVEQAGIHQSGVSRHLRILHEAGFVSMRPDGQRRLYCLRPEPFRELDKWLAQYRNLWEARLDRLGAALAKQQSSRKPQTRSKTRERQE